MGTLLNRLIEVLNEVVLTYTLDLCLKQKQEKYHNLSSNVKVSILQQEKGSAVAWWLMPWTSDLEVRGSSPTRVEPYCVLEQVTFTLPKYW